MRKTSILRVYASASRRASRGRRRLVAFALATLMHALGHAGLAFAGGALAAAWAKGTGSGAEGGALVVLCFAGAIAATLKALGGTYASYVQALFAGDVGGALRLDLLGRLLAVHRLREAGQRDQGAPTEGTVRVGHTARHVSALTARVREMEVGLAHGVLGGARAVAQLVPLVILLVVLSPRLSLVAVCVLAPFALLLGRARRAWKEANVRAAREHDALLEAADDAVRNADLWVTYGAQEKARRNVASLGERIAARAARIEASAAALGGANEILGAVALVLVVLAARAGWLGVTADAARLLPFAVAFFMAYKPLRDLTDARLALSRATAAHEAMTAAAPEEEALEETKARTWENAPLEVRDLETAQGASVSFDVKPGEIVAVVGATGAGKTTLLRALLGLERSSGEVRFGGASLDGAPAGPGHRPFAWVPQDAPLLADTLDANVALGKEGARARDVLAPFGASGLARDLEGARLGAAGRAVSGGERQWIAIARAVATELPVLLMDEPTSGLDAASQARVLEAIEKLRGERSIVLVTHRPEPLAIADRVVVLEHAASRANR